MIYYVLSEVVEKCNQHYLLLLHTIQPYIKIIVKQSKVICMQWKMWICRLS